MKIEKLYFIMKCSVIFSFFSACSSKNNQDSMTQSLVNRGHGWPGGNVRVCFINGGQYPLAAQIVQLAITSNFVKSSVGIEFTGWGDCKDNSSAEARVFFGVKGAYSTYVGTRKFMPIRKAYLT